VAACGLAGVSCSFFFFLLSIGRAISISLRTFIFFLSVDVQLFAIAIVVFKVITYPRHIGNQLSLSDEISIDYQHIGQNYSSYQSVSNIAPL